MQAPRFDTLARDLSRTDWSRRRLSRLFGAGAAALLLGTEAPEADARKKRKKKHKKQKPQSCVPDCSGKGCGDGDGCSGFCTACPSGQSCQAGQCVTTTCVPDCAGKSCGDPDGCGSGCTACPSGKTCQNGLCVGGCTPNCATKNCGDADGCGGRCLTPQGCGGWQCENFRCCVADEGCNAGSQGAPCCGTYGQTCGVVGTNPDGETLFGCQACVGCCITEDACGPGLIGVGCCGTFNRCWSTNNVTYGCIPSSIG